MRLLSRYICMYIIVLFASNAFACPRDVGPLLAEIQHNRLQRDFEHAVRLTDQLILELQDCKDSQQKTLGWLTAADIYTQLPATRSKATQIYTEISKYKFDDLSFQHNVHITAYERLGSIAFLNKEYDQAITYWSAQGNLMELIDSDNEYHQYRLKKLAEDLHMAETLRTQSRR